MISEISQHRELRRILASLTGPSPPRPRTRPDRARADEVDVVITPNEVNDRHGTGVLVRRVFEGPSGILSIRARDDYGGEHDFGDWSLLLAHGDAPRAEVFRNALAGLEGRRATRIVCVPYCPDDLLTAIALHDAFGAPLATWIMDDQNVAVARIPDALMREALEKSRLRLTTHPEMRRAYEKKYGLRFWLLPAVAPAALVAREVKVPSGAAAREHTGALVGSIWSQRWLELLCATVGPAGYSIDWFGNDRSPYFEISRQALAEAHIVPRGIAPEPELAQALRGHPYAVVPTGTLEGDGGDARALAELSLPGRILFVAATSHTPLVVLGSERTPASRFVERFGIGVTVPYEPQAFRRAVEAVVQPAEQERMRRNAARIAPVLSSRGVREWVWESLEHGMPADLRFEDLLPRQEDDLVPFIEAPVPAAIYREYVPIYQVLRRLRGRGVRFDFVLDVGASMGIWSFAASHVFPEARFVLVDPLAPRYGTSALKHLAGAIPRHELLEVAVSNRVGRTVLNVPPDLFGASLLEPADFRSYQQVEVPVTTVDEIARQRRLGGRGMLKVDVQCAEHLVLEGAAGLLPSLDAVVLELSLVRYHPEARTFVEMVGLMEGLGFRYYDDAGCWRSPVDGTLLQKDVVFLRREVCPTRIGPAPSRG